VRNVAKRDPVEVQEEILAVLVSILLLLKEEAKKKLGEVDEK
jgi:hypothetical protein